MISQYFISQYALPYLIVGFIITVLVDLTIYYTKSSSRFTFIEIWYSIILWPIVLYVFLKGFFNQD